MQDGGSIPNREGEGLTIPRRVETIKDRELLEGIRSTTLHLIAHFEANNQIDEKHRFGSEEGVTFYRSFHDIYDAAALPARQTFEYVDLLVKRQQEGLSIKMNYGYHYDITDPLYTVTIDTGDGQLVVEQGRESIADTMAEHAGAELVELLFDKIARDRSMM